MGLASCLMLFGPSRAWGEANSHGLGKLDLFRPQGGHLSCPQVTQHFFLPIFQLVAEAGVALEREPQPHTTFKTGRL